MKIPAKTEYALRALLELSLHWPSKEPLALHIIAKKQNIPLKFLTHILLTLKSLELIESTRGKQGGYLLKKAPSQISLADVLNQSVVLTVQTQQKGFVIHDVLKEVEERVTQYLRQITFEDLVKRQRAAVKIPMYSI